MTDRRGFLGACTALLAGFFFGWDKPLKGPPKPLIFGRVYNLQPPCVNSQKLVYQVHDGAVAQITEVRDHNAWDKPCALENGGDYGAMTALLDDRLAPAPGTFKTYLAGGYFRLGTSPYRHIAVDVEGLPGHPTTLRSGHGVTWKDLSEFNRKFGHLSLGERAKRG